MDETRKGDLIEAFQIIGNKAEAVDKYTFGVILRSLGMNPTGDEISDLFHKGASGTTIGVDACLAMANEFEASMKSKNSDAEYGSDPHASFPSALSLWCALPDITPLHRLRDAFAVFDKEKEGKISAAELRQVIANLGEKVDEDEIEEMMKEADRDGSGTIDYKEFVSVLMRPVNVPPRVVIPEHLKPFMTDKKKEAKKEEANAASA